MTGDADTGPIIGTADAASILGWTKRKVQRAAKTGAIPIVGTVGPQRNLLFEEAAIEEIAQHNDDD